MSTPFLYPKMRSSNGLPTVSIKNLEVVSSAQSVFTKCGVHLNSPLCFQKRRSSFQLPTLFLQNVQSAWSPHCLFKRCGVYMNSSLWFPKIRNSLELSTVFQKMRSWHELLLCRVRLNSLFFFLKMQSSNELRGLYLAWVNPYGIHGINVGWDHSQSIVPWTSWIPCGMIMEWSWNGQFHMESIAIPPGFHWIPYGI